MSAHVKLAVPGSHLFQKPLFREPYPSPFNCAYLTKFYNVTISATFPITFALVYFSLVHYINPLIVKRQENKSGTTIEELPKGKKLPPAPFPITKTIAFKIFVILHNLALCVYSVWTFLGMCLALKEIMKEVKTIAPVAGSIETFFQTVCNSDYGIWASDSFYYKLDIFGYWFYISKFYEVIDTIIIIFKGSPSSLLQSYHHAGAMMCMWSGIRYRAPPIWVFVVFNSFIHSLMYFYFFLSTLKLKVPIIFKRALTTLQIVQFVFGGSLAAAHAFIWTFDNSNDSFINCISSSDQALTLYFNVLYLTPLTGLFVAFYADNYFKKHKSASLKAGKTIQK